MCRLVDIKTNHGEDVRVADVKREEIINIINAASLCKKIDMLILYGSALEISRNRESEMIASEIVKKGKIIYKG